MQGSCRCCRGQLFVSNSTAWRIAILAKIFERGQSWPLSVGWSDQWQGWLAGPQTNAASLPSKAHVSTFLSDLVYAYAAHHHHALTAGADTPQRVAMSHEL